MEKELEKILRALAKKLFNLSDKQVDEYLYTDDTKTAIKPSAATELLKKDEERIATAKTEAETAEAAKLNEGYNKGKKESLGVLENSLKEKYGLKDSTKQGSELVEEIVTARVAAGKGKDLTEEQIKASDFYLRESKDWDKKFNELKIENETKLKEIENKQNEEKTLATVKKLAVKLFNEMNPILSEDETKAASQRELFVSQVLANNKFKVEGADGEETITILDEKNAPKKDGHGHLLKFDDLVTTKATALYDFKAAEDRQAPTNDDNKDKPKPGDKKDEKKEIWKGKIPGSQGEYLQLVADLEKKGDTKGITSLTEATEKAGVLNFKTTKSN